MTAIYCDEKGCMESIEIDWKGGYIEKWRCAEHEDKLAGDKLK